MAGEAWGQDPEDATGPDRHDPLPQPIRAAELLPGTCDDPWHLSCDQRPDHVARALDLADAGIAGPVAARVLAHEVRRLTAQTRHVQETNR